MDENRNVPYIVYESAMARAERTIKKLTIIAVVSLILMFIANIVWVFEWTQFDTISYTQDGEGLNNVNVGTQGDVLNEPESKNPQTEKRQKQRCKSSQKKKMRDHDLSRSEVEHLIDEWIFSERDRKILKRRLLDGIIFDQLSEEFEMSVRQIKKIVYKGQEKIFRHI